jgi:hypothetical protein
MTDVRVGRVMLLRRDKPRRIAVETEIRDRRPRYGEMLRAEEHPETDCVAEHIGFELRCAERKFISLNIRQGSDSREPTQTVLSFRRIIFWYHIGVRILSRGLIGFEPQRDIRIPR